MSKPVHVRVLTLGLLLVPVLATMFVLGGALRRETSFTTVTSPDREADPATRIVTIELALDPAESGHLDLNEIAHIVADSAGVARTDVKVLDESADPLFDGGKAVPATPTSPAR